jgi:hypothetical protein
MSIARSLPEMKKRPKKKDRGIQYERIEHGMPLKENLNDLKRFRCLLLRV